MQLSEPPFRVLTFFCFFFNLLFSWYTLQFVETLPSEIVPGYRFCLCIKVHLICCSNFPPAVVGQSSGKHSTGALNMREEMRRDGFLPEKHTVGDGRERRRRKKKKNETKARKSGWKDEREPGRRRRGGGGEKESR